MPALSHRLALLAILLPLAPASALAAAATASQNVNVRSGPATSYGVVTQLQQGDAVDVRQCEGAFCQVNFNGKTGWVSATYLTRDIVSRPAPQLPPANPQIASAPAPRIIMSPDAVAGAPRHDFPPAYNAGEAPSHRTLPPEAFASADDVPPATDDLPGGLSRPKADIPDGAPSGPGDDYAVIGGDPADGEFAGAPPDMGWRMTRRGLRPDRFERNRRPDFADAGAAQACFVDPGGGPAFCVREGEQVADLAEWAGQPLLLRNPDHLDVTVCTNAAYRDCRTYVDNGPVVFGGGRGIASVSVAVPGY